MNQAPTAPPPDPCPSSTPALVFQALVSFCWGRCWEVGGGLEQTSGVCPTSVHPADPLSCPLPVSLLLLVFLSPPLPLLLSFSPLSPHLSLSLSLSTTHICVDAMASLRSSHARTHTHKHAHHPCPYSQRRPEPPALPAAAASLPQPRLPPRGPSLQRPGYPSRPAPCPGSTRISPSAWKAAWWWAQEGCNGMCSLLFAGKQDG